MTLALFIAKTEQNIGDIEGKNMGFDLTVMV